MNKVSQSISNTLMKTIFALAFLLCSVVFLSGWKPMNNPALSLPFDIPPEYRVTNSDVEAIASPIPDQEPTTQSFVEITRDGKKAFIFYWDGPTMRDLGPMVAAETWKHPFLGKEAGISRTTMFMGQQQEVLVLHHKPGKATQLMIYTKEMTREEFHAFLDAIDINDK